MELEIELGPDPIKLRQNAPGAADVLVLPVSGPQGPTGPTGGDGFTHEQNTAAGTWVIDHNLGRKPHTTIIVNDEVVIADITHSSEDRVTITFASPKAGIAYLS